MPENREPYSDYTFCDACGSASTGLQFALHVTGADLASSECQECGVTGKMRPATEFEMGIMDTVPCCEGGPPPFSLCTVASIEDAVANGTEHMLVAVAHEDLPGVAKKGESLLLDKGHRDYFLVVIAVSDHDPRWARIEGLPAPRVHKIGKVVWYLYTK